MKSGFYNILKPTGFTSSDVVCKLKGILSMACRLPVKIGHLGTLDPGGSGVLVVAVGNATKMFDPMRNHRKTYRAEAVFGVSTDTLDSYGKITEKSDWFDNEKELNEDFYRNFYKNLDSIIESFVGKQNQLPPQYSSKSVNGKRAYDLARSGISVDLKESEITIFSLEIVSINRNRVTFDIECSGGTYIRSFVRDLGQKLGVPSYMSFIIRLNCCGFSINDSVTISEVAKDQNAGFVTLEEYSKRFPIFKIENEKINAFANGESFYNEDVDGLCLINVKDKNIGVGEFKNTKLHKICMFEKNPLSFDEYDKDINKQKLALALGYFDSFHVGHIAILKELCKSNGIPSVFTFSEQLSKVLSIKTDKDLYSFEDRVAFFEKHGVKYVFAEKPTKEFLSKEPFEFLEFLLSKLNIGTIVCGYDYTFGKNASGNIDTLKTFCFEHGITLKIVQEKSIKGEKISSSLIKQNLENGNIQKVKELLGRDYSILGKIIEGRKQGRTIGFPTVNIKLNSNLVVPKFGVYKGKIRINGKYYDALINIGDHPTFDDYSVNLEAYVLNFNQNVYGCLAEVFILKYIRETSKFNTIEDLVAQIHKDLEVFNESN